MRRLSDGENPGPEISIDKVLLGQAEQAVFDALRLLDQVDFVVGGEASDLVLREEWFYSRAATIFGGAADDPARHRRRARPRPAEGAAWPMTPDERQALEELAETHLAARRATSLVADIADSGLVAELAADHAAMGALFAAHGRHLATSTLMDVVLFPAERDLRLVLPVAGATSPPGHVRAGRIRVDGLLRGGPGQRLVLCADSGDVVEVPGDKLGQEPVSGLDPEAGFIRVSGVLTLDDCANVASGTSWDGLRKVAARMLGHELLGLCAGVG